VQALRQIVEVGTPEGRTDALWLLDFVRRYHGQAEADDGVSRLRDYLRYVEELGQLLKPCPDRCRLVPRSAPSPEREHVGRLTDALGLRLRDGDQRVELDTSGNARRKHAWLAALGADTNALVEALNSQAPVRIPVTDGVLPLPMPDYFRREVFRPEGPDVLAIAADRSTAWFYAALMMADEETLQALQTRPDLLRRLHQDNAATFVVASRSLRLRDGGVHTPGDSGAVAIWEDLVGRKRTDGERFTRDLLSRDSGRLAYFYSIVDQLDERRQAFVLGRHLPARERARFVDRIYRRFVTLDAGWSIESRPFHRPDFDPQLAFALVDVTDDGLVGPAWWPSLFERITDGTAWPDKPERTLRALKDRRADALWLTTWLFSTPEEAEQRFLVVRFAQRQFLKQPKAVAPAMEIALRSVRDLPVLPLALERMGFTDPTVYQMTALAARAVEGGGSERDMVDLQRWQAALALFEQIQRRHRGPDPVRLKTLTALAQVALLPRDRRSGAIGGWVTDVLLPAYVPADTDRAERDRVTIEAFTAVSSNAPPAFTWEGLEYGFDPSATLARGVSAILNAARVPRLSDVAALHGARRRIEAGVKTVEELKTIVADLTAIKAAVSALPTMDDRPPSIVADFDDLVRTLERLTTRPRDVGRAGRELGTLRRAIDEVTDAAVMATAYALASVPTGEAPQLFATRWTRHVVASQVDSGSRALVAWQTARSEPWPSGGTILRGSLIGLDLAVAESLLRRVGLPVASAPAIVSDPERAAILRRLVAHTTGQTDQAAFDAVVRGVAAGRARVAAWVATPPADAELSRALADAGVATETANVVRWGLRRGDPNALAVIGPAAVYRLGAEAALPDGWGPVAVRADGCWCAIAPLPAAPAAFAGRLGGGLASSLDSDLAVRLAELLSAARLPAVTWSAVLPFALQDWLDGVRQFSPEDGESVAVWPRLLDAARLEQYLLALVADGVFAAPKIGGQP
jgi:hypothetical protein